MDKYEQKYTREELERGLNARQKKMCRHYLLTGNKNEAMRRAGYSARTVKSDSTKAFNRPKTKQYIEYLKGNEDQLVGINRIKLLNYHNQIMDFDPAELFDGDGALISIKDLPENIRCCIASFTSQPVKEGEGWVTKTTIKFKDSQKSSQELAKLKGYYAAEKQEITVEKEMDFEGWEPSEIATFARTLKKAEQRKNG